MPHPTSAFSHARLAPLLRIDDQVMLEEAGLANGRFAVSADSRCASLLQHGPGSERPRVRRLHARVRRCGRGDPARAPRRLTGRPWCCCTAIRVRTRHGIAWRRCSPTRSSSSALTCAATGSRRFLPTRRSTLSPPSGRWPVTWSRSCGTSATSGSPWWATTAVRSSRFAPRWIIRASVTRLVVMDGLPVVEHLERLNEAFVRTWWHWWFFGQTEKPAERVINLDPDAWYRTPSPDEMGDGQPRRPLGGPARSGRRARDVRGLPSGPGHRSRA